ncbi:alpha/beta fold hydrolase [Marinomonas epiphytica]
MIHAKQYGSLEPQLIVIHGLFGNANNWHSIAQKLAEQFTVHCIDLPNHGRSAAMEDADYPKMAQSVLNWSAQQGIKEFYLLGHSMGGKVSMQMAYLAPERIKKLIVADIAPVDYPASHTSIFAGLKALEDTQLTSRKQADDVLSQYVDIKGVRQFLLTNLERSEQGLQLTMSRANIADSYQTILKRPPIDGIIDTPTLFIKGELSDYIIADYQTAINAIFKKVSFKMIPDTGHWLHAEKPLPFTSLVKRFLQS